MSPEETATRLKYLEKATNLMAEQLSKPGKGKALGTMPARNKPIQMPPGGIRIKLPAYDVHYRGHMIRVDLAALENDPELYAHMRQVHPTIFID